MTKASSFSVDAEGNVARLRRVKCVVEGVRTHLVISESVFSLGLTENDKAALLQTLWEIEDTAAKLKAQINSMTLVRDGVASEN